MSDEVRRRLELIDEGIAERCDSIAGSREWWPCQRGCADCCQRLADLPAMTPAEWRRLEAAFEALEPELRVSIARGIDEMLAERAGGAALVRCAFLDVDAGACRIYEARPAACRTYGFFVAGPRELWCSKIDAALDEHEGEAAGGVLWGNQHAVERKLVALSGARVAMEDWWADYGASLTRSGK